MCGAGEENLSKNRQKEKKKRGSDGMQGQGGVGRGGRVSKNQENWQNKLKKRNKLTTAPEKLLQSKDAFEKNISLYKMKNKMNVKKSPKPKSVKQNGWLGSQGGGLTYEVVAKWERRWQ